MKHTICLLLLCLIIVPSCSTVEEPPCDHPVMMLRLRPTNTDSDESWNRTLSIIKENPGCCDEVWFSTGMGYLPEEWHKDKVERIGKAIKQLEQIGIGASLQFQMTIGHGDKFGYGNEHLFTEKTWTGWTGSTGVESVFCSCPRHRDFIEHIRMMARMYASLKPAYIWVDDDLRYDNHKPASLDSHIGCWCEGCLAEFNALTQGRWTRESLAEELDKDTGLYEQWHSFCIEALCSIASCISEEVHKVSPETKMAFQAKKDQASIPHVGAILKVMHQSTGLPVGYRPGTGPRFDTEGASPQIIKSMQSARFISQIGDPDFVDLWCPEIETWPRVYGSRTGQGILIEGFTALAYGLNSISMFILAADMEDAELYSRSLLKPVAAGSDVLQRYARLNQGTDVVGYQSGEECDRLYEFARTGIPVLPGVGVSLGDITAAEMDRVNIPKQLSYDIQKVRDEYISPAQCCSPFMGLLIPRVSKADGSLKTVGVVNTRIDIQEQVMIRLNTLPEGRRHVLWREMKKKPVRLPVERDNAGGSYVTIPEISAWNAGFLEL